MHTYVLLHPQRRAGAQSREELKAAAARVNEAVRACHAEHPEHHIKWVTSYVSDDAVMAVLKASSQEVVQARAARRTSTVQSDAMRCDTASVGAARRARAAWHCTR